MIFACGDNEILRRFVLQHEPHALYVVWCVTPVATGAQITQIEFVLVALYDTGGCQSDFAGNEVFAAAL